MERKRHSDFIVKNEIQSVLIIDNKASGPKSRRLHRNEMMTRLPNLLHKYGVNNIQTIYISPEAANTENDIEEAFRREIDLVIVRGGDGTVNKLIEKVKGTETKVLVVGGGTQNVGKKEIFGKYHKNGIYKSVIRTLHDGEVVDAPVGVMEVTHQDEQTVKRDYFMNAGIGWDSDILQGYDEGRKKPWRSNMLLHIPMAMRVAKGAKPLHLEIEISDRAGNVKEVLSPTDLGEIAFVPIVRSGVYGGKFDVFPNPEDDTTIESNTLHAVVVPHRMMRGIRWVRPVVQAWRGKEKIKGLRYIHGEKITIRNKGAIDQISTHVDAEVTPKESVKEIVVYVDRSVKVARPK